MILLIDLWPDGSVFEIEHLDIRVSVDGMLKAALKMLLPAPILAAMFAASGGAAKSPAKAQRARRNGQKGRGTKKHLA